MLTSIPCPVSMSNSWVPFAGHLSRWIVQPLYVLPLLLGAFGLVGFLPRRYGRRPLRLSLAVLMSLYLVALSPPAMKLAEAFLSRPLPVDSGGSADAIVVLGRGRVLEQSRVEVAEQLWQAHRAPIVFASGVGDAPQIIRMLEQKGLPDLALQGEDCSRTTYENAEYTAKLLRPQGIQRILLVTDTPHMLRSFLTFRGFGFQVTPVPSSSLETLNQRNRARLVLREYLGLASYGLLGRFFAEPAKPEALPPHHHATLPVAAEST